MLEITFQDEPAVEIRGLIRTVLHSLVDDDVPHAHVVRLISEGRTSATVFEVSLRRGQEDQRWVVKIGPPDEMAREFRNYQKLVEPRRPVTCAPIVKELGNAVAYQHVASFAGLRSEPTPTLEEVVRQAYEGSEDALKRVLRVISTLFIRLGGAFYDRRTTRDTASLRPFNPRLGPDLLLTATLERHPLTSREVVFETTVGGGLLEPGSVIELDQASGDGVTVSGMADWRPEGVIENVRYDDRRALLADAAMDVPAADPSSALRKVLTDTRYGRLKSVGHGDLNPRNILLVGDETYVIDFAETADGLPLLWDPAWLEVGLMRDVFADLPHDELLQLQRVLALACRMRSLAQQPDDVEEACLRLLPDTLAVPFKVLFVLRCQALLLHGGDDAWENYLALLYFSGYRTLKWKNHNDPVRIRAVHTVLSTCAEWLMHRSPFLYWPRTCQAMSEIAPLLDLTKPEAIPLAASLCSEDVPAAVARELGGRLAVHQFWQRADDLCAELDLSHERYIDLAISFKDHLLDPINTFDQLPEAILLGEAGAGKTSTLLEYAFRLARNIVQARRSRSSGLPLRMPMLVDANLPPEISPDLLRLGAVHILVDNATEQTLVWANELRAAYPHTPVLLAMREAPESVGWPVFPLEPITDQQALDYIARASQQLTTSQRGMLADVIAGSKTPIKSPALLRMAIDHVRKQGDIRSMDEVLGRFFGAGYGADHQARPLVAQSVVLSVLEDEEIAECALSFARRETCLLAVRLRETPTRVVELLARTAWTDDPEYAAELLTAAVDPPDGLADELIAAQQAVLADASAGRFHHRAAANALATLGADKQLAEALVAQNAVPEVLDAIRALWTHDTTPEERRARKRVLCPAFDCVLTSGYPDDVVAAVLRAITDMQFTGLELLIADLIPDSPAALAAADTLKRLGVARPRRFRPTHHALIFARLNELEALLPTLSDLREIQEVENEREDRVLALQLPAEWEARLNSFGISDSVARWLERKPSPLTSPGQTDEEQALYIQQVFREDRQRGLRLAWSTTRESRWPWVSLLHQLRGSSDDLSALLESDEEGRACAVRALASRDYHRSAALRPRIMLTDVAREILSKRRDTDGVEWALAVAAAGMRQSLSDLLDLMEDKIAAATGLLARKSDSASRAHELLRLHDSVIGLAYLGDWVPLLTSADEQKVLAAGANALKRWAPGPFTPEALREADATAIWLDDALRTQEMTPEQRSLFAELKRHMEKKDGKLVSRR